MLLNMNARQQFRNRMKKRWGGGPIHEIFNIKAVLLSTVASQTGDSIFERDAVRRVVINRPTANRKFRPEEKQCKAQPEKKTCLFFGQAFGSGVGCFFAEISEIMCSRSSGAVQKQQSFLTSQRLTSSLRRLAPKLPLQLLNGFANLAPLQLGIGIP